MLGNTSISYDKQIIKVDNKTTLISNTTIDLSMWEMGETKEGFKLYANIPIAGLQTTDKDHLSVAFADKDRTNLEAFDQIAGSFRVYAKEPPTDTITIPSIVIIREVV